MIKETATYKGLTFDVVIDGGGLDVVATDEESLNDIKSMNNSVAQELFDKVFDFGYHKGLKLALETIGATVL